MAAERYSSEVLQMFYGPIAEQENAGLPQPLAESIISEAIKNLSPELREIILKEYISIKMKQREELGWKEVHKELGVTPFCARREMLVKIKFCFDHAECEVSGLCESCYREEAYHISQGFNEYKCYSRFIIRCVAEVEHAWIGCILRKLKPLVELRHLFFSDSDDDSEILSDSDSEIL